MFFGLNDVAFLAAVSGPPSTLLLDLYPNAAAAYSLRQLRTGVTNVVRVRRSSDNTESDFTATQVSDGTLTTFCGAGNGFVRTWYDQSGNGRHAVQTTTANQPQIVSSGAVVLVNSKAAIEFDGSNDLLVASPELTSAPQPVTFVSVHNAKTLPLLGEAPFSFASASTRAQGIIFQQNNGLQPAAVPRPAYPLNQSLFFYDQDMVADLLALNGTNISAIQASSNLNVYTGNLDIGRRNIGSLFMEHYEQELIIYPSSQRANRAQIEANVNTHYAIY